VVVAGITIAVYRNSQRAIVPPPTPAAPAAAVTLSLTPALSRSGSAAAPSTDAAAAASGIRFTLALPAGAPRLGTYPAAIVDPDGRSVWSGAATRAEGSAVIDVRQALSPNDYQIQLSSPTSTLTIATYSFRVR